MAGPKKTNARKRVNTPGASSSNPQHNALQDGIYRDPKTRAWAERPNATIIGERCIDETLADQTGIDDLFEALGWSEIWQKGGEYHPGLVIHFYANARVNRSTNTRFIETYIGGRSVTIRQTDFVQWCQLTPADSELPWVISEAAKSASKHNISVRVGARERNSRSIITATSLPAASERLIFEVLFRNIVPHAKPDLNDTDCFMLELITNAGHNDDELSISLSGLMFNRLCETVDKIAAHIDSPNNARQPALIFPCFLTQTLVSKGCAAPPTPTDPGSRLLDADAFHGLGFRFIEGQWVRRGRQQQQQQPAPQQQPPQQPVYDDEYWRRMEEMQRRIFEEMARQYNFPPGAGPSYPPPPPPDVP